MRVVDLSLDYSLLFVWRDTDTANLAPDLKVWACVFDLWCFHDSSRFPLDRCLLFESAKQLQLCSPPCACNCRPYTSGQASTRLPVALLRRCDPVQTKSEHDTGGNERRDTSAHRIWPRSDSQSLFPQRRSSPIVETHSHGVHACLFVGDFATDWPSWGVNVLRSSRMRVLLCNFAFRWRSKRERLPFLWDTSAPFGLHLKSGFCRKGRRAQVKHLRRKPVRILLGTFRHPRGRQSRNESRIELENPNLSTVVPICDNSNR